MNGERRLQQEAPSQTTGQAITYQCNDGTDTDRSARRETLDQIRAEHAWRPAPPERECPWCGAFPGEPCHALISTRKWRRPRRLLSSPDGSHPSRRDAA